MGREIRRVPPNWKHPEEEEFNQRTGRPELNYKPIYDQDVESAWKEWQERFAAWNAGEHDRIIAEYGEADYPKDQPYRAFCAWEFMPPDPVYYRPKWDESQATWFQVYETVSEGTPVTPPFATKEELIEYLVSHGDFWDQQRRAEGVTDVCCDPWSREAAEKFVNSGYAPSMMVTVTNGQVDIKEPRDGI